MTKSYIRFCGLFEGHTWKSSNKWFIELSKLLCKLYSMQGVSRVKINTLNMILCHCEEKCY